MLKILLLFLGNLFLHVNAYSQNLPKTNLQTSFVYYLTFTGINEREQVIDIQRHMGTQNGVKNVIVNRYPVRYIVLKSNRIINESEINGWLPPPVKLEYFGEGAQGKEKAIIIYNKSHKAGK